jgi:hypothetical protein
MFLQLHQESLMLGRRPNGFAEHYYVEWDDGLGKEKITFFLVMSIASTQVPGAEVGKEAFQLLQDHFLADLSGDPYDRFENSLREINEMVVKKEDELGVKFIPNMHVVCGVIQGDALYLSQRGDAQGYLVRKRHVSSITDGLCDEKNKDDLFQNIASGILDVSDSVILTTGHLVQFVTPSDVSKIFSEQSLGEAAKELEDLLGADLEDQMAMLSFEVLEKSEDAVIADVDADDEEGEDLAGRVKAELDLEDKEDSARTKRFKAAAKSLRTWALHEKRWAWLKEIKNWERKRLLTAATVLAVVVVVSVSALYLLTSKQRVMDDMQVKLDIAEENITQAGTRGAFDKAEAAVLLDEAEELAVEVLDSGILGGSASKVLDSVEEQRDYLDNVVSIDDELQLLTDFSGILGSAEIQGIEPYQDKMLVYTSNEAYQVLLGEAQSPDTIDSAERVIAADYFADQENVVMLTSSGKVIEYEEGNSQFSDNSDGSWNGGVDVESYSSKIYVLDSENNQIWKYQRGTYGYGSAIAYVSEEVDVSDSVSMAIDGNIWILNDDGSITKLLSGDEVEFDIDNGPLVPIDGAVQIYTELESTQFYVLDPEYDRILIYTKSGRDEGLTYSKQYAFNSLRGELVDMYVDIDRNAIVFVTTEALYELSF